MCSHCGVEVTELSTNTQHSFTQAIDLGADRAVSVVLIVFADVTLLGLRDLYIQKKVPLN